MRALLTESAAVVFHNGFLDLLYLYHSFVGGASGERHRLLHVLGKTVSHLYGTRFIAERIAKEANASLGKVFERCSGWAQRRREARKVAPQHRL